MPAPTALGFSLKTWAVALEPQDRGGLANRAFPFPLNLHAQLRNLQENDTTQLRRLNPYRLTQHAGGFVLVNLRTFFHRSTMAIRRGLFVCPVAVVFPTPEEAASAEHPSDQWKAHKQEVRFGGDCVDLGWTSSEVGATSINSPRWRWFDQRFQNIRITMGTLASSTFELTSIKARP
jgi:hypothetical protein